MAKDHKTLVYGMVSFLVYFVVLGILESLAGWNASALYAVVIKTFVPIVIGLVILLDLFGIKLTGNR